MIAEKTLQTLEFPKVLDKLAGHTSFSLSREMSLALRPLTDAEEVRELQARIREAVPTARVIYLEPDVYRPGLDPSPSTDAFVVKSEN